MNKNDLKKLLVSGFAVGCITMAQGAIANEGEKTNADDALATTEKTENLENAFAGGCGGEHGCHGRTAPKPNRAMTPEEEQEQIQNQGQGQGTGHSCAGQPRPQGRIA
jgi:hypothetical protein